MAFNRSEGRQARTGPTVLQDKLAILDPAAAPLETDAEAAQASSAGTFQSERKTGPQKRSHSAFAARLQPGQSRLPSGWAAATLAILIGLGLLAGAISSSGPDPQQAQQGE